jgi:hypothetical protein
MQYTETYLAPIISLFHELLQKRCHFLMSTKRNHELLDWEYKADVLNSTREVFEKAPNSLLRCMRCNLCHSPKLSHFRIPDILKHFCGEYCIILHLPI